MSKKKKIKEITCNCKICQQSRKIQDIISKLSKEDGKWLEDFYNYHLNIAEDVEWWKYKLSVFMDRVKKEVNNG